MLKPNLICHFSDNEIVFYNTKKEKLYKESIKNIVFENRIINIDNFNQTIEKFIKKHKLLKKIFNNEIVIITPAFYNEVDEYILLSIFEKLGFTEIKIENEIDLIKLPKNISKVKIDQNSLTYFYKKGSKIKYININFSQFVKKTDEEILELIKKYNKCFQVEKSYFYGSNINIKQLAEFVENKLKNKVYYYEENSLIIINSYIEKA